MKLVRPRFGYGLHRARTTAPVLCVVAGGKHLHLVKRIHVREHIQIRHAAGVHHISAINFPIVIFRAAPVD